jgi:hypothetical protein
MHRLLYCEHCDQVFSNVSEHNLHRNLKHQSTHQGKVTKDVLPKNMKCDFQCSQCNAKFVHHEYLTCHDKYFHGDNPMGKVFTNNKGKTVFKCMVCQHAFLNATSLMKHIASKHSSPFKPFQCNVCCKYFTSYGVLNTHKKVHSGQTWNCDICHAKFKLKSGLYTHILRAHSSKSVQCKICAKIYKSEVHLQSHMSYMHATKTPFSCELCDKAFNKLFQLNLHYKRVHNKVRIFCGICNSSFRLRQCLFRHIQNKHSNLVFSCSKCPAKLSSRQYYNAHMLNVHSTGCWKCGLCGATFKCKSYLKSHLAGMHTGLVLHCAQCKYSTRWKHAIRQHIIKNHFGKF